MLEMARDPRTAKRASQLSSVLPPDEETAHALIRDFWRVYLNDNPGHNGESPVYPPPPVPIHDYIEVREVAGVPYLRWQGQTTFRLAPNISMAAFATTLETPGAYRLDLVAHGLKKKQCEDVLKVAATKLRSIQSSAKSELSEEEQKAFERVHSSWAATPHSHKAGNRDQKSLVGRALLNDVPLIKLAIRATELAEWTRAVGDMVLEIRSEPAE